MHKTVRLQLYNCNSPNLCCAPVAHESDPVSSGCKNGAIHKYPGVIGISRVRLFIVCTAKETFRPSLPALLPSLGSNPSSAQRTKNMLPGVREAP
mmetsp:Transcript_4389/g.12838  ORF Transcript_4389/g.12838 Transcript_4389/m.12838 type:complete len:95 (-) Transcript_4389:537-821(-)